MESFEAGLADLRGDSLTFHVVEASAESFRWIACVPFFLDHLKTTEGSLRAMFKFIINLTTYLSIHLSIYLSICATLQLQVQIGLVVAHLLTNVRRNHKKLSCGLINALMPLIIDFHGPCGLSHLWPSILHVDSDQSSQRALGCDAATHQYLRKVRVTAEQAGSARMSPLFLGLMLIWAQGFQFI